jgi:predicted glycoside hydrolase/deacetylase ChbG (UPF0249 family)
MLAASPLALTIIADDLGLNGDPRDDAIIEAGTAGAIAGASLVVTTRHSASAAARAATAMPPLPLGLHLNLTEGAPLTPGAAPFPGKSGFWSPGAAPLDASLVRGEIDAQLDAFARLAGGALPTHIDGHNHVHVHPVVLEALTAAIAGRQRGTPEWVPWIRVPADVTGQRGLSAFLLEIDTLARRARAGRLAVARVRITDAFMGLATMGECMTRESVAAGLAAAREAGLAAAREAVPRAASVEWMCHPGRPMGADCTDADFFARSDERAHELQFLSAQSAWLRDELGVRIAYFDGVNP